VRVVAAEALGHHGSAADLTQALATLTELVPPDRNEVFVSMAALNALDALGPRAAPVADALRKSPRKGKVPDRRYDPYVPRLLEDVLAGLKGS
jgi:uncharacterized sulfatase